MLLKTKYRNIDIVFHRINTSCVSVQKCCLANYDFMNITKTKVEEIKLKIKKQYTTDDYISSFVTRKEPEINSNIEIV